MPFDLRHLKEIYRCFLIFIISIYFVFLSCSNSPSAMKVSKIPIIKKGEMSTAVLALVKHQNTINDGETLHTFPDGLVFYFIIYPANPDIYPSIKQYQNFFINNDPYWQNIPNSYNSQTIIYNERTFAEHEPEVFSRIKLKKNTIAFVQKTVIYGTVIPSEGIVTYRLYFGFGATLEEFEFRFRMRDVH